MHEPEPFKIEGPVEAFKLEVTTDNGATWHPVTPGLPLQLYSDVGLSEEQAFLMNAFVNSCKGRN